MDDQKVKFIRRFVENKYDTNYLPTLGVDITTKKIQIDDIQLKIILVDTAGILRPSYYRGASAIIIFFSKGNQDSFHQILTWKQDFENYIPIPLPIAIVGFQTEGEEAEEVSSEEAKTLAHELEAPYFECYPKRGGTEVEEIIQYLARKVISKKSR